MRSSPRRDREAAIGALDSSARPRWCSSPEVRRLRRCRDRASHAGASSYASDCHAQRPRNDQRSLNVDAGVPCGRRRSDAIIHRVHRRHSRKLARSRQTYGKRSGVALDVLLAQPIVGPFGVGVGVDYYVRSQHATVDAHVPHPFFFNQLRTGTFETDGAQRARSGDCTSRACGCHEPPDRSGFMVFGGPTIFHVSQTVVTDLMLDEQYPYDTLTITGVKTRTSERARWSAFTSVATSATSSARPRTMRTRGRRRALQPREDANSTTTAT